MATRQAQSIPHHTWTKVIGLPLEVYSIGQGNKDVLVTGNELILAEGFWSIKLVEEDDDGQAPAQPS